MNTEHVEVVGMSCGHCVAAVTGELRKLDGVVDVHVDLESGAVAIESMHELDREQIRAAVEEAGYELAG